MFFMPIEALQHSHPFARFYLHSSATKVDRGFGSGDCDCHVPAHGLSSSQGSFPLGASLQFHGPLGGGTIRYGEAQHPGPHGDQTLTVGVSNPSGLRQKEDLLLGLGPGIWGLAETQLSATTFKSCSGVLRAQARAMNREVRLLGGAPAPLRSGSTWAGRWTGVAALSDVPASRLDVPWPAEHWDSGRVMLARHWMNQLPITIGTFYGFAQGPTWLRARQLSDQLLETFTTELILGMAGVRLMVGDFNQEPGQLTQQIIWQQHGWRNAQQVAAELFQHQPVPTCKGSTERDQIWLSPEAIQLLRGLWVEDIFMDHSTVAIQLAIPPRTVVVQKWPRPAKIPWQEFDVQKWDPTCSSCFEPNADTTVFMTQWAGDFEDAVFARAESSSALHLPPRCRGRAQRLKPQRQELSTPTCKPSREGEVQARNSMVGHATSTWFKQLRRLQSLKHAVHAAKQSPAAITYRVELWEAIKSSTGFEPDFSTWWSTRDHEIQGVPQTLPLTVPEESVIATAIYDCFLLHFRKFEAWHLNERSSSLKMKYVGSLEAVYMDMRKDPRPGVSHLWKEQVYTILDVDYQGNQIHLDRNVQLEFDSVWFHEDHSLAITAVTGDICTVLSTINLAPGDEIVQRFFMTDTNDILKAFADHWKPRWSMMATVSDEDWQRIVGFAQHYMPTHAFTWEPLEITNWQRVVRKFKRNAARGPDGFSKDDLQQMPPSFTSALLEMLHAVETTEAEWPHQLAFGTVIGLSKIEHAHEEAHFRPITLFSTIYRTWSRLRTKDMIRQLAQLMPPEALGFLPHRETTEVWLILQAHIELMLQFQQDYAGLSTDLKRAFNHIGRSQVFMIAERIGMPSSLLLPWQKFLRTFVRRFDIHGSLGEEIPSSSGFPEGCPLSIVAMLTVNWCYHVYMRAFCPRVCSYSFVDNLTLAAREADQLAQAFFALQAICKLFGLMTDDDKTYVWALTRTTRASLQLLGFPCLSDASELGGAMTFGMSRRTRILRQRGKSLGPRWQKLRRSFAPGPQKIFMLSKIFWPQAFHGSASCLIADSYAQSLRREAVKALHLNGAGSNPLLRLSLADDMKADPGFFQVRLCLATFRRMLHKSPDLLQMWQTWMTRYGGQLLPGPFSRLIHCLSLLGWAIEAPPFFMDHEGHYWNLATVDRKTPTFLLEDAWLQYVASQTKHRTMMDLTGLDGYLTKLDCKHMSALHRARVSALHSGAFMTSYEHSKFDVEKSPMCILCHCEDDKEHWLRCPRFQHLRNNIPDWCADNLELPKCTLNHLLVPKQQCLVHWRKHLCGLSSPANVFLVSPPQQGYHHLFLDGSCTNDEYPMLNLAAWGVVNATLGEPLAAAHLCGITQTIDRAELSALLASLQWADGTELGLCLWSDSLSTVHTMEYVLKHGAVPDGIENADLWTEVHQLLQDRAGLATDVRWIPSHLSHDAGEDPFEDWVIRWNDAADRLAVYTNGARPLDLRRCYSAAKGTLDGWVQRLRQLRQFYFQVADLEVQSTEDAAVPVDVHSSDEENDILWLPWTDHLPISWKMQCLHGDHKVPGSFLVSIIDWICVAEHMDGRVRVVSDFELVFALLLDKEFLFPFSVDGTRTLQLRTPEFMFQRPTLAMMLRPVQIAMKCIHRMFPFVIRTPPLPNPTLGVYTKFAGTHMTLPDQLWSLMRSHVQSFTAKRAVRNAQDLARPAP